jgi:uncharacterized protein YggT (Ycf19 family)
VGAGRQLADARAGRQFLYDVCEPYLRIFRRVIPPLGPLDLSPIVGVIALYVLERLVNTLIGRVL